MQNILLPEKGEELETHVAKLEEIKEIIFKEELTQANKDYILRALEREDRVIKKEFNYNKVKDHLRKSLEDEPSPSSEGLAKEKEGLDEPPAGK